MDASILKKNSLITPQVGQGAYGIVVAVRDRETDKFFAIKKISRAFDHKIIIKRTLRELRILRLLKHANVTLSMLHP
jgi:serine/threonine protein kinase